MLFISLWSRHNNSPPKTETVVSDLKLEFKWAPESRVLLNLEAGGTGGKVILFQTGPNRPWLTEIYKSVPHPKGQSILEELFQANVIPSDDDFRIFRDFGDMVGLDMAFIKDSYRYHNKFDGFQNIPLGSYQHVGDNVMALIEKIANNPELANDNPKIGKMVYYDILGFFFISYSASVASVMSGVVIVISLLIFLISLKRFSLGINLKTLGYLIKIITAPICGMITTLITVIIGVYILDSLGYSMRWYRYPWLVIGDFIIPIILISTPFLFLVKPKNISLNAHSFLQAQIIRLIWTSLLLVGTLLGIRSIYPIFLIVLFDTLAFLVILSFHLEKKVWLWKIIYIMISIIPVIINMGTFYDILGFFIPLTGRMGNFKMPDMIIGLGTLVIGFLILTPYFSLILILKKPTNFYKIVLCLYGICLLSIFTPLRFPYSGDVDSPTPQRFWILHSQRIIHDENGDIVKNESGYFFMNMDRNSPKSVKAYVDDLNNAEDIVEDCRNFLMCGLPIAHPKMSDFIKFSSWIPVPEPPILPNPQVDLLVNSKIRISSNLTRYNLTIHGTDHSMFFVSPKKNFKLVNMNFLDELPKEDNLWNGRPYYFFVYTCGKNIDPLHAIFDIEGPDNFEGSTMDFAIVGNYVHPKKFTNTASFSEFLSKFPDWADLTTWVAIYRSWVI
ncbi:endoplasmic reticulum metallopeptidase 1-like [Coccinella septempunctata]|uniref:endoplasmic reticulum metallopeptidase 1-like n=1 Tax=Coccinella septempunctata TaxID=41139 RepID=UPI001D0803E0|nr:endoplasmic reticulum metallopeptidase 1-like [Coccinella septempunctata]